MEALIQELFEVLKKKMATVGTAESCTGGKVGAELSELSGSSAYFVGSVVSYSNDVKIKVLNVPEELIRNHGAVSQQVAEKMAVGGRELLKATYVVSITGIAGPGGGSPEKPVGTIWFGISGPEFVYSELKHFNGDRAQVRQLSVEHAIKLLIQKIKE